MLWYPLSSSAIWYGRAAWSKDVLSEERDDSRLLMPVGMFFVVVGGWLLSQCNRLLFEEQWMLLFSKSKMAATNFSQAGAELNIQDGGTYQP